MKVDPSRLGSGVKRWEWEEADDADTLLIVRREVFRPIVLGDLSHQVVAELVVCLLFVLFCHVRISDSFNTLVFYCFSPPVNS